MKVNELRLLKLEISEFIKEVAESCFVSMSRELYSDTILHDDKFEAAKKKFLKGLERRKNE